MDPEERKLLEETLELSKENNALLHKVRGVQKRATLWTGIKLFFIVGIALGAFYYLEPYLDRMVNVYSSFMEREEEVRSFFQGKQR